MLKQRKTNTTISDCNLNNLLTNEFDFDNVSLIQDELVNITFNKSKIIDSEFISNLTFNQFILNYLQFY